MGTYQKLLNLTYTDCALRTNYDQSIYSRLLLSWLCLSRITAHLEVKIWFLFKHESLPTGNKLLWKRGASVPQYFQYILNFLILGVKLHIHLWNVVVSFIFSSNLQFWYVEVRISRSILESPWDFEITRVDCIIFFIDTKEKPTETYVVGTYLLSTQLMFLWRNKRNNWMEKMPYLDLW